LAFRLGCGYQCEPAPKPSTPGFFFFSCDDPKVRTDRLDNLHACEVADAAHALAGLVSPFFGFFPDASREPVYISSAVNKWAKIGSLSSQFSFFLPISLSIGLAIEGSFVGLPRPISTRKKFRLARSYSRRMADRLFFSVLRPPSLPRDMGLGIDRPRALAPAYDYYLATPPPRFRLFV